ncbi:MAG: endonuclease III [Firmicutes bacterium]|nr:endonuclease III [Bacillota bacterium]
MKKNQLADPDTYFEMLAELLRKALGEPEVLHQSSPLAYCHTPLETLIATVLTQATSDRNALKSWRRFKRTFPKIESVLEVDESVLTEVIHSGGLANQKAKTIRAILKMIRERYRGLSLETIAKDRDSIRELLLSLPGVGPKTAACVLLFGFNLPAFPVDIHIQRIAMRMGWVEPRTRPEETQEILTSLIPPQYHSSLHILLLNLGRKYCRPHNPNCQECPLNRECLKKH